MRRWSHPSDFVLKTRREKNRRSLGALRMAMQPVTGFAPARSDVPFWRCFAF
jgi:hypothetical protein